ncbi:hypothetical protein KIN20_005797 [Parelaphostrongylus tenuis]|uniref:Uncharacterized protein n=1 Tax=Parelaphostrongylus tenuis TaxID=148309 RepID=A0AAD5MT90_PARTN|nr:hypothetical protein KIN20_005797 [Parelaphostrongylus tenuis]
MMKYVEHVKNQYASSTTNVAAMNIYNSEHRNSPAVSTNECRMHCEARPTADATKLQRLKVALFSMLAILPSINQQIFKHLNIYLCENASEEVYTDLLSSTFSPPISLFRTALICKLTFSWTKM